MTMLGQLVVTMAVFNVWVLVWAWYPLIFLPHYLTASKLFLIHLCHRISHHDSGICWALVAPLHLAVSIVHSGVSCLWSYQFQVMLHCLLVDLQRQEIIMLGFGAHTCSPFVLVGVYFNNCLMPIVFPVLSSPWLLWVIEDFCLQIFEHCLQVLASFHDWFLVSCGFPVVEVVLQKVC